MFLNSSWRNDKCLAGWREGVPQKRRDESSAGSRLQSEGKPEHVRALYFSAEIDANADMRLSATFGPQHHCANWAE